MYKNYIKPRRIRSKVYRIGETMISRQIEKHNGRPFKRVEVESQVINREVGVD